MPPINTGYLRWSLVFQYYGDCWLGHLSCNSARKLPIPIRHARWAGFGREPWWCGPTVVSASSSSVALRHGYFTPAVLISLGAGSDEIMGPATFSSGMTHINLYIILILASYIPKPLLTYASLLVQTPLGIISNVILVPMLPIFPGWLTQMIGLS